MPDWGHKHRWFLDLLAAVSIVVWCAFPSFAQISPGPLARAHQSLNGPTNCAVCHRFGGERTFRCLECHTEIANRIVAAKGLHATYKISPGSSQECSHCHSDHNGEDFPLIKWDPRAFDHKQTGYALEGKHSGLACNRCHSADKVSAVERTVIKIKDLNRTFLGVPESCITCHQDEHKGRLGSDCLQCHNFSDWKTTTVRQFDHSKTRYPLTGSHTQVACQKCHTSGPDNKPRYLGIPFGQCADCHSDAHHGSFTQGCQACHNTSNWKKVSVEAVNERFDHSRTKYPLLGKHAAADCLQCHANGDFKKPLAFQQCMDCHKPDPHKGQFAKRPTGIECAACHTVDGWKPSKFTVTDHASSAYPLQGGHAKAGCAQCHIPNGTDTLFKIKFARCTDCHGDQHAAQFAAAPFFNDCGRCHNLEGYKPSTFTLARHNETHFVLTGGHVAVACGDCHKESSDFTPKPTAIYHWQHLSCTSCHADPHKGQFTKRMLQARADGTAAGCEACHSTKSWKELSRFDHSKTSFPLLGTHRATTCIACHKPANMETTLLSVDFEAAPAKCEGCHEDVHGGQFANGQTAPCADCHNSAKWKPSLFDHDRRTAFPLQGAHRNVKCAACHKLTRDIDSKTVLFYKPTPKDCAACHGTSKTLANLSVSGKARIPTQP